MRDYGRVAPTFWTRGTGMRLRGDPTTQCVALYLMSAPFSNMIGLYYLPVTTIAHDLGSPLEGAWKALARLSEEGFCTYSEASEMVFVRTMARRQLGLKDGEVLKPKDHRAAGILRMLKECGDSQLLRAFWDEYKHTLLLPDPWWNEAPSKPLGRPLEAPPKPGSGTSSGAGAGTSNDVEVRDEPSPGLVPVEELPKAEPKEPKASKTAQPSPVELVFDYWRAHLAPKAKLDDKRRAIIARALKTYTVEELRLAVDGTLLDDWRMGRDPRTNGKRYIGVDLVFRDAEHIDKAIALVDSPPALPDEEPGHWIPEPEPEPDPEGEELVDITPERIGELISIVGGRHG
jgi:hypothetical protein